MKKTFTHRNTGRIIEILEMAARSEDGYTFMEFATELNIPKGSISPILKTLRENNFLSYNDLTLRYGIGIRLLELGYCFISNKKYLDSIKEKIQKIIDLCDESCYFGILEHGKVVYLIHIHSQKAIRMIDRIGQTLPAYSTAIGKALLLNISSVDQLKEIYSEGLKAITDKTITSYDVLYSQICDIKKTGFAYESEESTEHLTCVAKPIFKNNKVVAALSIATPTFRCNKDIRKEQEELLTKYVSEIEGILKNIDITSLKTV